MSDTPTKTPTAYRSFLDWQRLKRQRTALTGAVMVTRVLYLACGLWAGHLLVYRDGTGVYLLGVGVVLCVFGALLECRRDDVAKAADTAQGSYLCAEAQYREVEQ
jgi:hypothetical protein